MIQPPIYKIGDEGYHITPESGKGIVINIQYEYLSKMHTYQVTFGPDIQSLWYYEHELSSEKVIV